MNDDIVRWAHYLMDYDRSSSSDFQVLYDFRETYPWLCLRNPVATTNGDFVPGTRKCFHDRIRGMITTNSRQVIAENVRDEQCLATGMAIKLHDGWWLCRATSTWGSAPELS